MAKKGLNLYEKTGAVAHRFSRKCSSQFQNQTYNQTFPKSMCVTNLLRFSDFRENLLHMFLFWVLILLDSYAYSYKKGAVACATAPSHFLF